MIVDFVCLLKISKFILYHQNITIQMKQFPEWCVFQEGHSVCEKQDVGLLVVMIWLDICTSHSSSTLVEGFSVQWCMPTQQREIGGEREREQERESFVSKEYKQCSKSSLTDFMYNFTTSIQDFSLTTHFCYCRVHYIRQRWWIAFTAEVPWGCRCFFTKNT